MPLKILNILFFIFEGFQSILDSLHFISVRGGDAVKGIIIIVQQNSYYNLADLVG